MFILWVVVGGWEQSEQAVSKTDALRRPRAVRTFVEQSNVYFARGILAHHRRYDTAKD